ncbi:FAS1 domain-containing protein [Poronia punctata]|nr:FAS1 domain-containing protein [Poronia punctata]
MQLKKASIFALASPAAAQNQTNFVDALQSRNETLSSFNAVLLQYPEFVQSLSNEQNITILAPNNDAFERLRGRNNSNTDSALSSPGYLEALLRYHVLNGTHYASDITNTPQFIPTKLTNESYTNVTNGQRVEAVLNGNNATFIGGLKHSATVENPNLNFTGGTIHIINECMTVPGNVTETLPAANLTAAAGAIRAANMSQEVTDARDVTIFAPSNEAFDAIGSLIEAIANGTDTNSTQRLRRVVGYHVVPGTIAFTSDLGNTTLRTLDGTDLPVQVVDGRIYVGSARITVPDVLVSNGVVHGIDKVLNPDDPSGAPDLSPSPTTTSPAFSGASGGIGGIPFTIGVSTATETITATPPGASGTGAGDGDGNGNGNGNGGQTTSPARGIAVPAATGAVGFAALFGGAAVIANL